MQLSLASLFTRLTGSNPSSSLRALHLHFFQSILTHQSIMLISLLFNVISCTTVRKQNAKRVYELAAMYQEKSQYIQATAAAAWNAVAVHT